MANLLQKASIVLTPTAYDDGKVLCAKPSEAPYGDFDFSRNSAATRVNAQGLVENVQILSGNLVQNGDFSEQGAEQVSNGSFYDGETDWTFATSWSVGEDKAVAVTTGNTNGLLQTSTITSGKTYKATFEVLDYQSGSVRINLGGAGTSGVGNLVSANGVYTQYITSDGVDVYVQGRSGFNGSVTNISVKEVGQNWSLNSATIELGKLTLNSVGGAMTYASQSGLTLVANTSYLISINATRISGDTNLAFGSGGVNNVVGSPIISTSGIQSYNFTPTTNLSGFGLKRNAGGSGAVWDITNISVIEITDDTNLPRINYEGFSYQDALGSEEIVNGTFDTDLSGWNNTNSYWQWSSQGAYHPLGSVNNGLGQYFTNQSNKLTFSVEIISGTLVVEFGGNHAFTESGVYTIYGTTAFLNFKRSGSLECYIDNVSVKEYLGQEVVPNSGCGSWLFEPQTTQLIPYSEDFSQYSVGGSPIINGGFLAPDGTNNAYKITNSGSSTLYLSGIPNLSGTSTRSIYARSVSGTGTASLMSYFGNTNNLFTLTEQWQRFEVNVTTTTTGESNFYAADFRGSGTLTEYLIWGANATNDQDYVTSYIPTSGSTVTRNQDVCNNGGSLATINSTEGVLYAEIAALANDGTIREISINNGSIFNRVSIYYTASVIYAKWQGANGGIDLFHIIPEVTDFHKVAIKYKSGDTALWVDGLEVDTSSSVNSTSGLNVLDFDRADGANNFYGKTKAVAVWKEALSDEELAELTYPTPTDPTFTLDFDTIAEQFTFARGSEATYVDAQGLIKSTNELGEELVVNGDFATDSDWSKGTGWSIGNGKATYDGLSGTQQIISSGTSVIPQIGKTYKVSFDVLEQGSGANSTFFGGVLLSVANLSVGSYVFYVTATSTSRFGIFGRDGSVFSIDNVSVKEVITATNTPRLDYSTGAEAFLLEPQSTNLVTQSELFSDSSWVKQQTTITQNATISPSGLIDASMMSEDNTNNYHRIRRNISLSVDATLSIFAKKGTNDKFLLWSGSNGVGFDLTLGTINNVSGLNPPSSSSIKDFGNGWYRCSITDNSISAFEVFSLQDFSGFIYQGSSTNNFYIWGAQLEEGYATSYIPSNGSQTTRNQETCINATPEINSEEGVLYAEISALADDGTYRLISLNDGTSANIVQMYYAPAANRITAEIKVGNVSQAGFNYTVSDTTDIHKIAFKYKENDFALWIDGVEVGTDASGAVLTAGTLTELDFSIGSGSFPFFGNTKDIQVYTKALSDAELIKLTT